MEALDAVELLKPTIEAINESYTLYQQEEKTKKTADGTQKLLLTEEFPFSSETTMPSTTSNYPSAYYNYNNPPSQPVEIIKYR
jgi:hypothetical protein